MTSNTERPDNRQIRALKARAQRLDPVIKIGRAGLTPGLVAAMDKALADHELVKVKFTELKDQKDALSEQLAAQTSSFMIWRVGHVAVFFRRKPAPAETSEDAVEAELPNPSRDETPLDAAAGSRPRSTPSSTAPSRSRR